MDALRNLASMAGWLLGVIGGILLAAGVLAALSLIFLAFLAVGTAGLLAMSPVVAVHSRRWWVGRRL